ncbi:Oxygen-dependent choline dehydrogenase [Orchesella cincta]|uniref:Oxygen-dependent choline dehydrogenase n=1 Tax=Orchesella cincta TaxID=48709 RepID=A0A1D2MF95_ORCCI|nr:Oxygen-dependent choline dehydrogenase [Orchesella cincta]
MEEHLILNVDHLNTFPEIIGGVSLADELVQRYIPWELVVWAQLLIQNSVVDASVFPAVPNSNIKVPILMIAEKAVADIFQEWV